VATDYNDPIDATNYPLIPGPLERLRRDLRDASLRGLSPSEIRYIVDLYYQVQGFRIGANNQTRALEKADEPNLLIGWARDSFVTIEDDIQKALSKWTREEPTGLAFWARSILGIGPVITAGLMAHIDITQASSPSAVWRFAGLDPTSSWLGREKAAALVNEVVPARADVTAEHVATLALRANRNPDRLAAMAQRDEGNITRASLTAALAKRPYNADLKRLCFLIGESFIKVQNNAKDVYGKLYAQRKAKEAEANEQGAFSEQAATVLANKRIGHDTDAYRAYSVGKLPPAHLHARARRYAVKIFLSHYWCVAYYLTYDRIPPRAYAIEHLGHVDEIPIPNMLPAMREAYEAARKGTVRSVLPEAGQES